MTRRGWSAVIVSAFLSGCASTPDVTLNYYGTKWTTVGAVTQTIGCSADKKRLVALPVVSVTTSYISDDKKPLQIKVKDLDGWFADTDFAVSLTEDGRLKGVNATTTGQGETIVKSAVGLLAAAGGVQKFAFEGRAAIPECDEIEKWAGAKVPFTLTYRKTINSASLGQAFDLEPATESQGLYDLIKGRLPKLTLHVGTATVAASRPTYPAAASDVVLLKLYETAFVDLTFKQDDKVISTSRLIVSADSHYEVPIPKAALFGKQTFTLAVSEAGAVTSIGYSKTTGSAAAFNALASVATIDTASANAKAAELKAQADLLAQQQRLVICETRPADCK